MLGEVRGKDCMSVEANVTVLTRLGLRSNSAQCCGRGREVWHPVTTRLNSMDSEVVHPDSFRQHEHLGFCQNKNMSTKPRQYAIDYTRQIRKIWRHCWDVKKMLQIFKLYGGDSISRILLWSSSLRHHQLGACAKLASENFWNFFWTVNTDLAHN